jgi:hypothetical protein
MIAVVRLVLEMSSICCATLFVKTPTFLRCAFSVAGFETIARISVLARLNTQTVTSQRPA